MKTTKNPIEVACIAWDQTHEENFQEMANDILAIIHQDDPPVTGSEEFTARVMELAWKTGFACGLHFMASGAIRAFPIDGNN